MYYTSSPLIQAVHHKDLKMTPPLFSIVIPTCGRPLLLRRALQSVAGQTFTDFECVVVDDAGEPDAAETVHQLNDKRFRVIRHQRNSGAAAAYNTGIRASRGELICILDDDDEYHDDFLEKTNSFFQEAPDDIGFVWTGIELTSDATDGEILLKKQIWPAKFNSPETAYIAATTIGNGFGLTMRRRCLDIIGLYNEDYRVCVDTEHLFRLARKFDFATIPEALVKIHQHQGDQLTHQNKNELRLKLHEQLLKENAEFLNEFPKLNYVHYRRLVEICYSLKMKAKGRRMMMDLWKRTPRNAFILIDLFFYLLSQNSVGFCRVSKFADSLKDE